jgi:acetylornithine deacetylase
VLFNFHVDTVPATDAWETDPFTLEVDDERAVGLGACDIKGASACMLAALDETDADVGLLFTSDEEAGSSRCVRDFVDDADFGYETVVVAEPTQAEAVLEHRGIITCNAVFEGIPGHASSRRALDDSAVHRLMRWGRRALRFAEQHEETSYGPLSGIRLNIGRIEGGIKPNVIAPSARVRFGCRPLPHQDAHALLEQLQQLSGTDAVTWKEGFYGPTLPAGAGQGRDVAAPARTWATEAGLPIGEPVDFWTEASLFSAAGYVALVFGPGDIAQAHTAGEWVALEQLDRVARTYVSLLKSGISTA